METNILIVDNSVYVLNLQGCNKPTNAIYYF